MFARAFISALAMFVGALVGAASAFAAERVDFEIGEDGSLRLDLGDGVVLEESRGGVPEPGGRLGFRIGERWYHATGIASTGPRRRSPIRLDTDDPQGRQIELRVGERGQGSLGIKARVLGDGAEVSGLGIGFEAPRGERYLGFGERSNAVDQRGRVVENYVGEGPYPPEEYPIIRATVPPWGFLERPDDTYFPMPWMISSRGYGALLEGSEVSRFRLGSGDPEEWSVEVDGDRLRLRLFAGPTPAKLVRKLTAVTGRQPKAAAPWQWGPWFQTGHGNTAPDELDHLETLRDADAPVSVAETHMRYMPCGSDQGSERQERARTKAFHERGVAVLSYTREAICESYAEPFSQAVRRDALIERADGSPYTFEGFVGSGVQEIGMLDFSDPEAAPIYESILDRAYRAGYDGWMEDYGEYFPPDAHAENGLTGARMHNLYPVLYHRAGYSYARSKQRPIIRHTRSGWTGAHPYTQIKWGGDPTTGWGFDGLRSSITEALTMGLSGISTWGSDIGGFFTFSDERLTPELLERWIQFGAFSGVMRTKAEGIGVGLEDRPQIWEPKMIDTWRRYAKLRTQLYPYIAAADRTYRRTGMPIMRHLALSYPNDRRALGIEDQFMFGDDLLVAPVSEPGARERRVYLPRGRWLDFWEAIRLRRSSGDLRLRPAEAIRGGRRITAEAPLGQIPIYVKAGAALPLLPARVDTLADPKGSRGVVSLADVEGEAELIAMPKGRGTIRVRGAKVRYRASAKGIDLRVRAKPRTSLDLQVSTSALRRPFDIRRVGLRVPDGRARARWLGERARVRIDAGRARVRIRR